MEKKEYLEKFLAILDEMYPLPEARSKPLRDTAYNLLSLEDSKFYPLLSHVEESYRRAFTSYTAIRQAHVSLGKVSENYSSLVSLLDAMLTDQQEMTRSSLRLSKELVKRIKN
jgi:translation initiation factor 2B subunit (eIF-2B alpha/beta/delta family)